MDNSSSFDANSFLIEQNIERAKSGNRDAALDILDNFYSHLIAHKLPDWRYMDYLADCLKAIIEESADPDVALNIKNNEKSRPKDKNIERRNQEIAVEVQLLRNDGLTKDEASYEVNRRRWPNIDRSSTIKKAYDENKNIAEAIVAYMQTRGRSTGN